MPQNHHQANHNRYKERQKKKQYLPNLFLAQETEPDVEVGQQQKTGENDQ